MTNRKYTWIRVDKMSKELLDQRLKNINESDLKKMGLFNKKVSQIDLTSFLFKNRVFISDGELKKLARSKVKSSKLR